MGAKKRSFIRETVCNPKTWLIVGFVSFCVLTFLAAAIQQIDLEDKFFLWVYSWPAALLPLFLTITISASSWAFLAFLVVSFVFSRDKWFVRIFASGAIAYAVSLSIKWVLQRPRPADLLLDIVPKDPYAAGFGFPSAHAALATAVGLGVYDLVPAKAKPFLIIWILAVGLSRMYLGVHVPLDVVGGFALGLAIAGFVRIISVKSKST